MPWLPASVHVFTASGAVLALLAAAAVIDQQAEAVFAWLALALIVDGIDGTFARALHVKERLPRFSGERLDLVVDYLTYVFVPVLALLQWRYLSGTLGAMFAAGILLSSLYHFSDLDSKAGDHCFVGFPAVWNAVAFYVFAFDLSATAVLLVTALCIGATFVPMSWLHPLRVERWRILNWTVSAVFLATALWVIWSGFPADLTAQIVLAACALYAFGLAVFWKRLAA